MRVWEFSWNFLGPLCLEFLGPPLKAITSCNLVGNLLGCFLENKSGRPKQEYEQEDVKIIQKSKSNQIFIWLIIK